jgi:hypothetical protein
MSPIIQVRPSASSGPPQNLLFGSPSHPLLGRIRRLLAALCWLETYNPRMCCVGHVCAVKVSAFAAGNRECPCTSKSLPGLSEHGICGVSSVGLVESELLARACNHVPELFSKSPLLPFGELVGWCQPGGLQDVSPGNLRHILSQIGFCLCIYPVLGLSISSGDLFPIVGTIASRVKASRR